MKVNEMGIRLEESERESGSMLKVFTALLVLIDVLISNRSASM